MIGYTSDLFKLTTSELILQLCTTVIVFFAIKLLLFIRVRRRRFKLFQHYRIPNPECDIIGGNYYIYNRYASARFRADEELKRKYGKTYGVFIGDMPKIVTTDLDILKGVFFEKMSSFKERTQTFLQTPLTTYSILFAPYHRWKLMRKIISPSFSRYQVRDSEAIQFVEECVELLLDYIDTKLKDGIDGKARIDIQSLMKATALYTISSMAITLPNVQVKEEESYVKSLDSFLDTTSSRVIEYAIKFPLVRIFLNFIATHFEYDKTMALIHRCLQKTIDLKLEQYDTGNESSNFKQENLIDSMIRLHHEGKLSREEVIANADAVLFAGYDTSSTCLTYLFWILGKHTEVQEKLRRELAAYGTDSNYLEQVINETMRLYPIVVSFTTRLATETVQIGNLTIPQGTAVVFNSWLVHRDPEIWSDPLRFDPERFAIGNKMHLCAFGPFGFGERKCLGYYLALLEIKKVVCNVLLRYKISLVAPQVLELGTHAEVMTRPKEKVIIELERVQS